MGMDAFKLLPQEDARQALRMKRFFLACGTSLMVLFLFFLYYLTGLLDIDVLKQVVLLWAALVAIFYSVIRSGLNRKLPDPSMTALMILASTLVLLMVMKEVRGDRSLLLLVYLVPFVFGMLRLPTTTMLALALTFLFGYGWIISADPRAPGSMGSGLQILQWVVPAIVMAWFALFSGYISQLRKNLAESNAQLADALTQVQNVISHDDLTGLYNRRHMNEVLALEKTRCERGAGPFCVLMMDIDRFKSINDSYGHAAGDEVLKTFADSMKEILRPSDFFGRIGGEEFLLVSTQTTLEGALILAERLRSKCESTLFPSLPNEWAVTLSIGVTQFRNGEGVDLPLLRADAALYSAKQGGRNRVETSQ
jgi:diguanylate cyclase (GGDEF)-like protein